MSPWTSAALGATAMGLIWAAGARAEVIAYWDFNDANLAVDQGAGSLTVTGRTPAYLGGTTIQAQPGVAPGFGLAITGNGQFFIDFAIDTTGFEDLAVSFVYRGDESWRRNPPSSGGVQVLQRSSPNGGASFTNLTQTAPLEEFYGYNFRFGASYDDNPNVIFRLYQWPFFTVAGDYYVIDNVTFSGMRIPQPPAPPVAAPPGLVLFGLGLAMLARLRRRDGTRRRGAPSPRALRSAARSSC